MGVAYEGECCDEAVVDESFLLRVLRDLVDRHILPSATPSPEAPAVGLASSASEVRGAQPLEDSPDDCFERRMESLWDLCVEPRTAAFVAAHRGLAVLAGTVQQTTGEGRAAEICLGTLANICAHRAVAEGFCATDFSDLTNATLRGLSSSDGLAVVQALRLACALLCGPAAHGCLELLAEAAIERYLFCLEHSLRWEVVQHACNALSQGLVLEANASEGELPSATDPPQRLRISVLLVRGQLAQLLAARVGELARAVAGDEVGEDAPEGDPEAALLSALCLAESFITVTETSPAGITSLGDAALLALASADRPEVVAATLELLATLGQALQADTDLAASTTGVGVEEVEAARRRLLAKAQGFAASTPGLAEKLTLLLAEGAGLENVGTVTGVALGLLQHAPSADVAEHREDLAAAMERIRAAAEDDQEGCEEGMAALGGVSTRFLEWLSGPPAEEVQ